MSRENVELVLRMQVRPDWDVAHLFRDENRRTAMAETIARFVHSDFECVIRRFDAEKTYVGSEGLTAIWLDWMAPWATYRTEIEEAIDLGDQVLLLVRDFGRREESTQEVELTAAAVWTVRDGKITRAEFYPTRNEALKAVGLRE